MADTVVEANGQSSIENSAGLWGPYYISPSVGAKVALDNGDDVNVYRTTDGGSTWTPTEVDATGAVSLRCFVDKEVPGDAENLIHIWWLNSTNGVLKYRTFDISGNSLGTERTVATIVSGESASVSSRMAGCKTRNGNLLIAGRVSAVTNTIFHYRSTDAGANWTSRAAIWENVGSDCGNYYPANTGDGADAALLYQDDSVPELSVKMYDDSADTVTETVVRTGFDPGSAAAAEAQHSWDAALRHSDGVICYAGWNAVNSATADLVTGTLNPNSIAAPTAANTTNVLTDTAASGGCAVAVDQNTDEVFVAYLKGGTWQATVDVKFKKSADGMSTWGAEQNYSEDAADDYRRVTGPRSIVDTGGIVQWAWFDDDDADIFINLTNDVVIPAAAMPQEFDAVTSVIELVSPIATAIYDREFEDSAAVVEVESPDAASHGVPPLTAPALASVVEVVNPDALGVFPALSQPSIIEVLTPPAAMRVFTHRIPQGQAGLVVFGPDFAAVEGLAGPIPILQGRTVRRENALTTWEASVPLDAQTVEGVPLHRLIRRGWHVHIVQDGNHPLNEPERERLLTYGVVLHKQYVKDEDERRVLRLSGTSRNQHLVDNSTHRGLSFTGQGVLAIAEDLVDGEDIIGPGGDVVMAGTEPDAQPTIRFSDQSRWQALLKDAELGRCSVREGWDDDKPELRRIDIPPDPGIRFVKVESADPDLRFYALDGLGAIAAGAPNVSYDGMRVVNRIVPYGSDTVTGEDDPDLTLEHATTAAPYEVKSALNPDASTRYYIEDEDSIERYGLVEVELFRSDIKNPSDNSGTRAAAANVLYAVAVGELLKRKSEVNAIEAPVVNGADIWLLPGDIVHIDYADWVKGAPGTPEEGENLVWLDENRRMLVTERTDEFGESGVRDVKFVLAAPEVEMTIPDLPEAIILPPVDNNPFYPEPPYDPGGPDVDPGDFPTSPDCCDDPDTDVEDGAEPPPEVIIGVPPIIVVPGGGGTPTGLFAVQPASEEPFDQRFYVLLSNGDWSPRGAHGDGVDIWNWASGGRFWVWNSNESFFHLSQDGALTFSDISSEAPVEIGPVDSTGRIYACFGFLPSPIFNLRYSDDAGASWTPILNGGIEHITLKQGDNNRIASVEFTNPGYMVHVSNDRGANWETLVLGSATRAAVVWLSSGRVLALYTTDGSTFLSRYSDDDGITWSVEIEAGNSLSGIPLMRSLGDVAWAVLRFTSPASADILRTLDGGDTWEVIEGPAVSGVARHSPPVATLGRLYVLLEVSTGTRQLWYLPDASAATPGAWTQDTSAPAGLWGIGQLAGA